jgi:hypothetical protein
MRSQRNGERTVAASRVSGLGICDALRVTLEPIQIRWLRDELDEVCRALEETRAIGVVSEPRDRSAEDYRLHLLRLVREQIVKPIDGEDLVLVGPSMMLGDLIRGAMRHAIETLAEIASAQSLSHEDTVQALGDASVAAAAWVETYRDALAVETFSFDPAADPFTYW